MLSFLIYTADLSEGSLGESFNPHNSACCGSWAVVGRGTSDNQKIRAKWNGS